MCTKSAIIKPHVMLLVLVVPLIHKMWLLCGKNILKSFTTLILIINIALFFEEKIENFSDVSFTSLFSVKDVRVTTYLQKRDNAPGPDNIHMGAFIHGGYRLGMIIMSLVHFTEPQLRLW